MSAGWDDVEETGCWALWSDQGRLLGQVTPEGRWSTEDPASPPFGILTGGPAPSAAEAMRQADAALEARRALVEATAAERRARFDDVLGRIAETAHRLVPNASEITAAERLLASLESPWRSSGGRAP